MNKEHFLILENWQHWFIKQLSPSNRWSQSKRWWQQHKMTIVIELSKRPMCEAHTLPPIEHIKLINPTCHIYLWHHMIYIGNVKCHHVPLRLIHQSMYIKWKKLSHFLWPKIRRFVFLLPPSTEEFTATTSRPILKNAKYEKGVENVKKLSWCSWQC